MFATLIVIAVAIFSIAILVGIILLIVSLTRKREEGNGRFKMKSLLRAYLHLMCFLTLLIAAFGIMPAIKATLSYPLGYQFSYNLQTYFTPSDNDRRDDYVDPYYQNHEIIEVDGKKYYANTEQRTKDVVNGFTITISMLVLFALHRVALLFLEPRSEGHSSLIKFYTFLSLTTYGILGLIAVPAAVYSLVNYLVLDTELTSYSRTIPGEDLAAAAIIVPLWIVFLVQTVLIYRKSK